MEFIEKLGEWITSITSWVERVIRGIFGSSNERLIKQVGFVRDKDGNDTRVLGSMLDRVHQLEPEMEKLTEGEMKEMTDKLRAKLADGKTLDDILPEAFAAVREAGKRFLKMRHYDVQLVGGHILHKGKIAEMVTGEGKTLVATLPSYLNALAGNVHVVTVNDYLALRDMEWIGPVHLGLGLTVGAIQSQMDFEERNNAYRCDITYGTSSEFGFDYLRDNMKPTRDRQVQGNLDYALVDEIDNILIDEARTPLIISGPAHQDVTLYAKAHRVAIQLKRDEHFEVKEKEHTCHMTDEGNRRAEELVGVDSFYTAGNMEWPHLIDNALRAIHLYKNDVDYVVERGEIIIIDDTTGRKMEGRQWSDGLHQAVEAKEGVEIKEPTQTLATITLQNYFKLYKKLSGMTGTAMTESNEFWKIYKLDVVAVPTNRPLRRRNYPDVIYRTENEKWDAVLEEVREVHKTGRPILVGTVSIEKSELLSGKLTRHGIKHDLLNAKQHEREADIISQAGRLNAVTIATNMAGRGTDIILGGNPEHMAWEELKQKYHSRLDVPKVEWDSYTNQVAEREGMIKEGGQVREAGGLHVIGTERHDARRIDLQLRGRAGRQGDPGESRFFLSFEDPLLRRFAGEAVKRIMDMTMKEGEAIESKMFTRQIEKAQKKREEQMFDQRKNLLEYDEVMDEQRKRIYSYRQRILDGINCRDLIFDMLKQQVEQKTEELSSPEYRWQTIAAWADNEYNIQFGSSEIRNMVQDQLEQWLRDNALRQAKSQISDQVNESLPLEGDPDTDWNWAALSRSVNAQFGLNTNDRELKKQGRDPLKEELISRAEKSIASYDFSRLDDFLSEDFPKRALAGWLIHQYGMEIKSEDLDGMEPEQMVEFLYQKKVQELYRNQEIRFPATVGMTRFVSTSGQGTDREGLGNWAKLRFDSSDVESNFQNKSKHGLLDELTKISEKFYDQGAVIFELESKLDDIFGMQDEQSGPLVGPAAINVQSDGGQKTDSSKFAALVEWANTHFTNELTVEDVAGIGRENVRQKVLQAYDARYRPEFSHTERSLILSLLDSAWKEHLYYMDHLRSGIGLMGYAQKDPKVEYKREGMKAFETMWLNIGEQITYSIFRVEEQSDFVGSLWDITETIHENFVETASADSSLGEYDESGSTGGGEVEAIETIRNRDEKVGRNDPCPCGSGKKYKKCHGSV